MPPLSSSPACSFFHLLPFLDSGLTLNTSTEYLLCFYYSVPVSCFFKYLSLFNLLVLIAVAESYTEHDDYLYVIQP